MDPLLPPPVKDFKFAHQIYLIRARKARKKVGIVSTKEIGVG